ncbi:dopamine N-acetyltransferase [Drosophila madeirensis]|uniref:aralkylamine N-acetyltransferase n=1 Tax=Drosophila madeirensis TaxID=30013 RepID=A0AAU9FXT1_DROMD
MEYKLIGPEHYEDVIDHLRRNFFADEPLNKAAGLCQKGFGNSELEHHSLETLQDQLSLMAVARSEGPGQAGCKIAGVILNGILRPGDTVLALQKLQASSDINFKKIFELLYNHNLKVDLFGRFKVDRIFDVRILSVDASYRGQGIAKELVKHAESLARKRGFRLLKADATGIFSQKILRSHGFELFAEQLYAKYTDAGGQVVLPVEAPHIKLQLLTKKVGHDEADVDVEPQ